MRAVRADDPKRAVKRLLMAHRDKPYFNDLLGEAKMILLLEEHSERRKMANYTAKP